MMETRKVESPNGKDDSRPPVLTQSQSAATYGGQRSSVAPLASGSHHDVAKLTAEAIEASTGKAIADVRATVEAAAGMLEIMRSDAREFEEFMRPKGAAMADHLMKFLGACEGASDAMLSHRELLLSIMREGIKDGTKKP